jgi:hypothetical protein
MFAVRRAWQLSLQQTLTMSHLAVEDSVTPHFVGSYGNHFTGRCHRSRLWALIVNIAPASILPKGHSDVFVLTQRNLVATGSNIGDLNKSSWQNTKHPCKGTPDPSSSPARVAGDSGLGFVRQRR